MSLVIYLIGTIDKIQDLATFVMVVSFIFACVCLITIMVTTMISGDALDPKAEEKHLPVTSDERMGLLVRGKALAGFRQALPYLVVFGLLHIAIPDSKTLVAAYVIPKVVNNEKLGAMVGSSADLINMQLSNWVAQVSSSLPTPAKEKNAVKPEGKK